MMTRDDDHLKEDIVMSADFEAVSDMRAAANLLLSQGFAIIEVGDRVRWEMANPVFAGIRAINELPPDIQNLLRVDRSKNGDQDDGLMIRHPEVVNPHSFNTRRKADHKIIFHYREGLQAFLQEERGMFTGVEWQPFFNAQSQIRYIAIEIATEVATEIDRITDWRWKLQDRIRTHVRESKLRSQLYLGARADDPEVTAREHPDRSLLTVHILENHPGLEIRTRDGERRVVHAMPGRVIVFAGSQLQELSGGVRRIRETDGGKVEDFVEGGEVPALLHGAKLVNTVEHPWSGTRAMCVAFIKGIRDPYDVPFETN